MSLIFSAGLSGLRIIGFTIDNFEISCLKKPVWLSFRKPHQLDVSVLQAQIERVVQSNERFVMNAPMTVKITRVDMPIGMKYSRKRDYTSNYEDFCASKKSIILIRNTSTNISQSSSSSHNCNVAS